MKAMFRFFALAVLLCSCGRLAADDPLEYAVESLDLTCDASALPVSDWPIVSVTRFWVSGNTLFADFDVQNRSAHALRLPSRNIDFQYWGATVFSRDGQTISYCGGVRDTPLPDTFELDVLSSKDIVLVPPLGRASFRSIPLAPFWWYVWDHKPTHALVEYQGAAFSFMLPKNLVPRLGPAIHAASELQCGLFPGPILAEPTLLPQGPEDK